ncbi:VOC family protein [Shinella sp. DD12]|uniref:VOC family protein n=1 Tax=Shinella sp. DD12 TaxID=1410620 RepID=UPI0004379DFD|nr:VOC family protein [Shinella sp. DD12]EYR77459.1 putative dioxygenase of extradiol dioxygenase family [Shinella sp. DD12]
MAFQVTAYEHVGIRVTDRDAAREFYGKLGWREAIDLPEHHANEMVNDAGIYINLIFNGVKRDRNILQDEPLKYPGVTHVAFVVKEFDDLLAMLDREGIPLSGGPYIYSDRRRVIFVRDPDRNVLEFNEVFA